MKRNNPLQLTGELNIYDGGTGGLVEKRTVDVGEKAKKQTKKSQAQSEHHRRLAGVHLAPISEVSATTCHLVNT